MPRPANSSERPAPRPDVSSHNERVQSLHDRYVETSSPVADVQAMSDAERYRWIRENRGSTMISDALMNANFDADFDAQIDAAIQAHRCGRHLPIPVRTGRPMYGRRRTD